MPLRRFCSFLAALSLSVLLTSQDVRAAEPRSSVQGRPTGSLGAHLDAEGYLSLPDGFSGNLDPTGFRLVSGTGEAPRFASIDGTSRPSGWIPFGGLAHGCNGTVLAFAVGPGGEIYLGGSFSLCGDAVANHIVRYDPASGEWSALGHDGGNGVNDTVQAILVDGADVYVGGRFTQANAGAPVAAAYVARWDGSQWRGLGQGMSGHIAGSIGVRALAMMGSELYVGGRFTHAGGATANSIARWDGQGWSALSVGAVVGVDGEVFALATHQERLYVAGRLSLPPSIAPPDTRGIVRWDGDQWTTFGNPARSGVPMIRSLLVSDDAIHVAGRFYPIDNIGQPEINHIARWDGQAWTPLGSGAGNGVDADIWSMVMVDGVLHVGGAFLHANVGQPVAISGIARWNGVEWSALPGQGGEGVGGTKLQPPSVRVLAHHADALWVAGGFKEVNAGAPLRAYAIARWRDQQWSRVGEVDTQALNAGVSAIAVHGTDVYVAGGFTEAGGIAANHIARWDGSRWSALGSGGGNGVDRFVLALALGEGGLYVGGAFHEANVGAGIRAPFVAHWDFISEEWSAVDDAEGGADIEGPDRHVVAMAVDGEQLFAATQYFVHGWNGASWARLPGYAVGSMPAATRLRALAHFKGELYAAGDFDHFQVGEASIFGVRGIVRWDGNRWAAVGHDGGAGVGFSPPFSGASIYALLPLGDQLYVAGHFDRVNVGAPVDAFGIARWDGAAWRAVGGGSELLQDIRAIASDGEVLYAAGRHSPPAGGGYFGRAVARWDGRGWSIVSRGFNGIWSIWHETAHIDALAVDDRRQLFVGGHFAGVGGRASAYVAGYADERIFENGFDTRTDLGAVDVAER